MTSIDRICRRDVIPSHSNTLTHLDNTKIELLPYTHDSSSRQPPLPILRRDALQIKKCRTEIVKARHTLIETYRELVKKRDELNWTTALVNGEKQTRANCQSTTSHRQLPTHYSLTESSGLLLNDNAVALLTLFLDGPWPNFDTDFCRLLVLTTLY